MASSVAATMGMAGIVVPVRNASGLSSSSSFGSPLVNAAPLRPVARRNVLVTRAALPEEQAGRREVLASLMAAGAALSTAGMSWAASGPGGSGGKRTNEKAKDLLTDADALTKDDSPPRFGPGRVGGGDETNQIAQKGGAGADESIQGAGGDPVQAAKDAVSKAKSRVDKIFGRKTSDISDASSVFNDPAGKVASDVDTAKSKVNSDISTAKEGSGSFFGEAQSKVDSSSKDAKDFFGGIKGQIENAIPQ